MGFELDEIIYKKVLKYFKNKRLNDVETLSRQINLSDIKPRLTLFTIASSLGTKRQKNGQIRNE